MTPPSHMRDAADGSERDDRYFRLFADALEKCAGYRPALGQGGKDGLSLDEFQNLYHADPFYSWIGLDSPLVYAAHRAAGGMTSIYRQIGIGCERLFREILQESLGLTSEEVRWSYELPLPSGKSRMLSLDGRVALEHLRNLDAQQRLRQWFNEASSKLLIDPALTLSGAVFEVRQGYKSMDSKRQNADIANAANAYLHRYLPVLFLLSTQIDPALVDRYTRERWLILTGTLNGTTTTSAYTFCRDVVGYDLAAFMARNSSRMRATVEHVLSTLLTA